MSKRGSGGVTDVKDVAVGDIDIMAMAAVRHRMPICPEVNPSSHRQCARAAGHDDGEWARDHHPAVRHVAVDRRHVVEEVW